MSFLRYFHRSNTPSGSTRGSTPSLDESRRIQAPFAQVSDIQTSQPLSSADKEVADKTRMLCERFRILIIGRANAGKTTILQKVCGTTEAPIICNAKGKKRGMHDIQNEMTFESNPGFVFHDSRGFESGGRDELDDVQAFIMSRSQEVKLQDQLHAIWYCIPMGDDRPFTRAEILFFSECGTGSVPVITIFTKFDAMDDKAFAELLKQGMPDDAARIQAPSHAFTMFEKDIKDILYETKYPPKGHVLLRELIQTADMNDPQATCNELVACTANAIDDKALKLLFVIVQRSNLTVKDLKQSSQMAGHAAAWVIVLELAYFIWDKSGSKECIEEAFVIYEAAKSNHDTVMAAVQEACEANKGDTEPERTAFITKMKEIVVTHRLSDTYKAQLNQE
ncbi:hypothetical protein HWV62_27593 [Athelia sp. TMB]|nr:hypothetical protein HWV62_27593 [Athelia sp. TMB]